MRKIDAMLGDSVFKVMNSLRPNGAINAITANQIGLVLDVVSQAKGTMQDFSKLVETDLLGSQKVIVRGNNSTFTIVSISDLVSRSIFLHQSFDQDPSVQPFPSSEAEKLELLMGRPQTKAVKYEIVKRDPWRNFVLAQSVITFKDKHFHNSAGIEIIKQTDPEFGTNLGEINSTAFQILADFRQAASY